MEFHILINPRDAGATYERWKDEKENRDIERENMQALQQEFEAMKIKCHEYKIESQDWKTKYEKVTNDQLI